MSFVYNESYFTNLSLSDTALLTVRFYYSILACRQEYKLIQK